MTAFIKAAVIGHPVAHSKSPRIHNYWIQKYGLKSAYEALDITPEMLQQEIAKLVAEGYSGFNVTLPHKESILRLCDEIDDTAKAVGAVNTVVIKGGKLHGMNTDVFGFIQNILDARPNFDFTAGPVIILGAGGAAKATLYGLLQHKTPEIRILNRTKDKAQAMAKGHKNVKIIDWEDRSAVLKDANLLINTTSLGMTGKDALDIDLKDLNPNTTVSDIVYAPLITDLLQQALMRGNPIIPGIGMLLQQARPAFKAWFGIMPDIDETLIQMVQS